MNSQSAAGGMNPAQFIAKWSRVELSERAASQEHFIDLCRLLGQPTPAEHDATGAEYTFEKGVAVTAPASRGAKGDGGFADVWWRGKFGWEYKRRGKYADLTDAYRQLCQYREALENPPLLIVCDIARIEIHTNFTGTAKEVHTIALDELDRPERLSLLRRVFTDPDSFRPNVTTDAVTKEVAQQFALISQSLESRGNDPHAAAHFLMKCMFCLFAEDVSLLPDRLFARMLGQWVSKPARLQERLTDLFAKMRTGGAFGAEPIARFNGGLFDDSPALHLTRADIGEVLLAAKQDWSSVEPAIFGTLFERSLDPAKRAQIGAHYTSRDDIMLIVEPVVMGPLRRQWSEIQAQCEQLTDKRSQAVSRRRKGAQKKGERTPAWYTAQIGKALQGFLEYLAGLRILDPACGSGNFLYVAIQELLNLEKQVITFAARLGVSLLPTVRPTQLHGIEINPFAAELAQVVIWIGYLQWMRDNGFNPPRDPILEPLKTIENRDAILDLSDPNLPVPAEWPDADFIIGNPPFLGSKLFRGSGLPDEYVKAMYAAFDLPRTSDLCCYWFELARRAIHRQNGTRAGLLATQSIRGGANRDVLKRIKETGDMFMAWADRPWILDGAAVHVSMVGFDDGTQQDRTLDGAAEIEINTDLTDGTDTTKAEQLEENANIAFMGDTKVGPFDIDWAVARQQLVMPNPDGRDNTAVLRPWINGMDITRRLRSMWIIDFPPGMSLAEASRYEAPFEYALQHVRPFRKKARSGDATGVDWWIHQRPRPDMRDAVSDCARFVVTCRVAKHRLLGWAQNPTLPDSATFCFARSDDYFFGVLHSSVHELWARRMGTQLREAESGCRYTPTTCFETFALPWRPGAEPADDPAYVRISAAAEKLNALRERWLNPPEWIEPIARRVDNTEDFSAVPAAARALLRQSAIMSLAAQDKDLKRRTLTNLYNERPTWLKLAHHELDSAVLAAYASVDPDGQWSADWADVWRETGAGHALPEGDSMAAERGQVDQRVLENLLRLNGERAGRDV